MANRDTIMSVHNSPIILVDGSSYLYRAFHALPALANSKGRPTGAVYGMINMLKRIITDYKPTHMAVVFDAKGKTFRDDLYADYKATRKAMPDDLALQIPPIHNIIKAMGIPLIMIEGVEADDVIGTLTARLKNSSEQFLISTGDKDLAQLVNDKVKLINTMSNTLLDTEGVKTKFGISPNQVIDYLSLIGDTSDNIPGVPKVGPKTAAKWLNEYGNLDNIVAHATQIPGKIGENLRASIAQFPLAKSLATIKMDVHLPFTIEDLKIQPADKSSLIQYFKEMEFKSWLNDLLQEAAYQQKPQTNYPVIQDESALNVLLTKLNNTNAFALQIIASSSNYMQASILGISFSWAAKEAVYIPLVQEPTMGDHQLSKSAVLKALQPLFDNESIAKIGHHLKFLIEVIAVEGFKLKGKLFDTMLESYLLDSASNAHELPSLALKYLGARVQTQEEIAGKGVKKRELQSLSLQEISQYTAAHVDHIYQLHQVLWERMKKETRLQSVFNDIEMRLLPVLAQMERIGVLLDPDKLIQHGKTMQLRLEELEQEAYQLAGMQFNLNSPKQLQEILFNVLKLPVLQKTPTGQPSTADHVLQELAHDFALPRLIIEYRGLSKLISTYTSRLVEQLDPQTKRIHTFYNQSATSTGRLSSSEPNLQNIPIRSTEGRRIRQAFIAPPGYKILSADYSQIELRIMAHISQDPNLLRAFQKDIDIHTATAAEVWEVAIDEVTPDMRRNAKAINFGLMYGMSAFGLTRQLGIERKAAQEYIDRYFARYPNVKTYMENTRRQVKETGFVETLWGRRLYLPDIHASQIPRQRAAERAAINAPLQGSAADIIKLAMISIQDWLDQNHLPAKMIMQVHDELVFEVPEDKLESISKKIRTLMCNVAQLSVPLQVSIGSGPNWDAASSH